MSDHGHPHEHSHDPPAVRSRPTLDGGAGSTLFIDPVAGIAGDMMVAALADLGVSGEVFEDAVSALALPGLRVTLRPTMAGAMAATTCEVSFAPGQPERSWSEIRGLLEGAPLEDRARALALRIFARLAEAEARVHRTSIEAVHFHEVGAVDSIADVVLVAAGLASLGPELEVTCAPLPIGRGRTDSRHGPLPLPAPATLLCLEGLLTEDAGIDGELVTPTGAAIVGAVARRQERWPTLRVRAVGYGRGTKTWPDRPNVLRLVLGERGASASPPLWLLEANVDDLTGEVAAHVIERLIEAGARDAWASPITMKKGRPALQLQVLADGASAGLLERVLFEESTTLGVRRIPVERTELPRETETVETPYGLVRVKVARLADGSRRIKPELDDCRALAARSEVPLQTVLAAAVRSAER